MQVKHLPLIPMSSQMIKIKTKSISDISFNNKWGSQQSMGSAVTNLAIKIDK